MSLERDDEAESGGGTAVLDAPPDDDSRDDPRGGGAGTVAPPRTARGRDWAALRQFSVFLENRVGNLADLTRTLENARLRIVGLTIQESADAAVARLIVDDYERAHELFDLSDFCCFESDVVAVELPDVPNPLTDACRTLLRAELSVHYAYTIALPHTPRGGRRAARRRRGPRPERAGQQPLHGRHRRRPEGPVRLTAPTPAEPPGRTRRWWVRPLKWALTAAVLAFVGWRAWGLWEDASRRPFDLRPLWLGPAGLAYLAGWLPSVWVFRALLARVGAAGRLGRRGAGVLLRAPRQVRPG